MRDDVTPRLLPQLGDHETDLLASLLATLAERVDDVLGATLAGVYLTGSFALGAGDTHADVDFLVAVHHGLDATQEAAVRDLHRVLPDEQQHWAQVLEGSYATLDDLRARADPHAPWLYVDNGSRQMQWSAHDNTEVCRWVLHHRAVVVSGPDPATLVDDVPPPALRAEAAALAAHRALDVAADRDYLMNAWGQPHEVLTQCRLLYTAAHARVVGKTEAARWTRGVVAGEWHDLIDLAIADRPDPWARVHRQTEPARAERTWQFVQLMGSLIARTAVADEAADPLPADPST